MRYLFAALLLVACTGPNPDYDPTAAALYWSQGDSGAPDMATSPDLSSPTCGRPGEPCCLDASARRFCTVGACYGERCGVPDLAVPPDLRPMPPDMSCLPYGIRDGGLAGNGERACCTGISPSYPELDWCCAPAGAACQRFGDCCNGAPCGSDKRCQGS